MRFTAGRNSKHRAAWACVVALLTIIAAGCVPDRPLVEQFDRDTWQPDTFQSIAMEGQRSGAAFTFVLELGADGDRRLTLEGEFEINPQPVLTRGRWTEQAAGTVSGNVSSAVLDFFGGQGDRPSLGGQFTLSTADTPVYRINLPATPLWEGR